LKRKAVRALGVILALLLLAALSFQHFLRLGLMLLAAFMTFRSDDRLKTKVCGEPILS
jgi:hypothetical protein